MRTGQGDFPGRIVGHQSTLHQVAEQSAERGDLAADRAQRYTALREPERPAAEVGRLGQFGPELVGMVACNEARELEDVGVIRQNGVSRTVQLTPKICQK